MENNIHIAKKTYIPLNELKRKQMVTMVKKKKKKKGHGKWIILLMHLRAAGV